MPSNTTKCIGCGVVLQTEDPTKLGYIPNHDHIFCKSCYQLMHYGKAEGHSHPDNLPNFEKKSLIVVNLFWRSWENLFWLERSVPEVSLN